MLIHSLRCSPRAALPLVTTLVAALALALASHGVQAESALTLDRALQLAQARSREIAAQDASASASREMAVAAGQLPDPTLKAAITNLPVTGNDRFSLTRDFMTMRSIGVMQEFTRADKREARTARFERAAEAAEAGGALALARLRQGVAAAWLERHFQERVRELLLGQRQEAALQVEAADAAYRGGRGSQADAFAARTAVALIDDRILQSDRQIAIAFTELARWIGDGAHAALAAPPDLARLSLDAQDVEALLAHHPRIVLLTRQEELARADADIARTGKRADWSVELMYSQRGPSYSNMVSLNVSVPLQVDPANRQDRDIAAKLALADEARALRDEATREYAAQTRSWLQQWRGNRDRMAHYDGTLIPLSAERTRAALASYRGGAPLLAVLDARRAGIDTRIERLKLEMETASLWARLEYLIPPAAHAPVSHAALTATSSATEVRP